MVLCLTVALVVVGVAKYNNEVGLESRLHNLV